MRTSASIGAIAAALAKAQGLIRNAGKDAANPFFKSKYAPLDTVIDCIREALAKNEIAYVQSATSTGPMVSLVTVLAHASGEWIEADPLSASAKDGGAQAIGSTVTYLRRYSLMAAVGVAATDDDDAEAAEGRPVSEKASRKERPHGPTQSNEEARAAVKAATSPIEAYKQEALKEAVRLLGDAIKAKAYLNGVRADPKAERPWDENDCERVKSSLALLEAKNGHIQA